MSGHTRTRGPIPVGVRIAAAVAATVFLGAVIVGTPWLLVTQIGWPLPDHLPSLDELRIWLQARPDTQFLLAALTCVAWPLWALFTLDTIIGLADTIIAAVTRRAPRTPRGPVQALAAALIGVIVAGILSLQRDAPTSMPVTADIDITRLHAVSPAASTVDTPRPPAALTAATSPAVHLVKSGDTIESIAAQHLGSPDQWRAIWAANKHRIQNDGTRYTYPSELRPGWALRITLTANNNTVSMPRSDSRVDGAGDRSYTVVDGDCLWDIAQDKLGDPMRWQDIFALNTDRITDPDLIYPGQTLRMPTPPSPQPSTSDSTPPATPTPPTVGPSNKPAPPATPAERPDTSADTSTENPSTQDGDEQPSATETAPAGVFALPGAAWISVGLVACLSAAIALANLQRRRRRDYQHPTRDPGEQNDSPDRMSLIEVLRGPRAISRAAGVLTDPIDGATTDVAVPFAVSHDGEPINVEDAMRGGLGLHGDGTIGAARAVVAAALSAGHSRDTDSRAHIACTTTEWDCLLVTETTSEQGANAGTAVDALADRLHLDDNLEALCARAERELVARTRVLDSRHASIGTQSGEPPDVVASFAPWILLARPTADTRHRLAGILAAGARLGIVGVLFDANWPRACTINANGTVTITHHSESTAEPTSAILADAQANILSARYLSETLTICAHASGYAPPSADTAVSKPDTADTSDSGTPLVARNTAAESSRSAPPRSTPRPTPRGNADVVHPLRRVAVINPPSRQPQSERSTSERQSSNSTVNAVAATSTNSVDQERPSAAIVVTVLGRFQLSIDGHPIQDGLRAKAEELLAFLAAHRGGVSSATICDALWPGAAPRTASNYLYTVIGSIRTLFRHHTGDGKGQFIVSRQRQYVLDTALFDVDLWHLYEALAVSRTAQSCGDSHRERDALATVFDVAAGSFTTGRDEGDWAETIREDLRHQICTALTRLAILETQTRPEHAIAVLEHLTAIHDPYNEPLHRQLMTLYAQTGRDDAIPRLYRRLRTTLADLGVEPDPESQALSKKLATMVHPPQRPRAV